MNKKIGDFFMVAEGRRPVAGRAVPGLVLDGHDSVEPAAGGLVL